MNLVAAALVVASLAAPAPVLAWGRDGHQIIAAIAQSFLTPRAAALANGLLAAAGGESFVGVSDWADRIRREEPETAGWHFVDIEVGAGSYDPARDCPPPHSCAVAKINEFRAELADTGLDPERRGEALKWLIHLVGDLHQPLHAADRHDRGGNDLQVIYRGKPHNLHGLWDTEFVKRDRGSAKHGADRAYAADLEHNIAAVERAAWAGGSPADWANESHMIAERITYGELPAGSPPVLDARYVEDAEIAVQTQMMRVGVRLAALLMQLYPEI